MSVFRGSVYVGICMWVQAYLDGCECFIGSVYVGICMWVQGYLDGYECVHR